MDRARRILVAVLVVLLVLAVCVWWRSRRYDAYLGGLWVADAGWLADAGLDSAYLYVGEVGGGAGAGGILSVSRPAYLVMERGGELVCNQGLDLARPRLDARAAADVLMSPVRRMRTRAKLTYDDAASACTPGALDLAVSIEGGSLALSAGGVVYGLFFKDHAVAA